MVTKAKCEECEAKDGQLREILAWMRRTQSGFAILEGRGAVTLSVLDLWEQEKRDREAKLL